jgi:predicted DNA-binding transcriptional regulator YafY
VSTPRDIQDRSIAQQLTLALHLMELLQQQEFTPVKELAGKLGRSRRTVERVFAQLRDADLPVYSGRGGYGMTPSSSLPCYLTPQEQVALTLVSHFGLPGLGQATHDAIQGLTRRLRRHMSIQTQARLNELQPLIATTNQNEEIGREVWEQLSHALAMQFRIRFRYKALTTSDLSNRQVEPWGIFRIGSTWYLQAYDLDRQSERTFRLNRIEALQVQPISIHRPAAYQVSEALFHSWDIGEEPSVDVELELSPKLARWLAENPVHPRQKLEGFRLTVPVRNYSFFVNWLLSLEGARLIGPETVRQSVRASLALRERDLLLR